MIWRTPSLNAAKPDHAFDDEMDIGALPARRDKIDTGADLDDHSAEAEDRRPFLRAQRREALQPGGETFERGCGGL